MELVIVSNDTEMCISRVELYAALSLGHLAEGDAVIYLDSQDIQQTMLVLGSIYNRINSDRKCSVAFEIEDSDD